MGVWAYARQRANAGSCFAAVSGRSAGVCLRGCLRPEEHGSSLIVGLVAGMLLFHRSLLCAAFSNARVAETLPAEE